MKIDADELIPCPECGDKVKRKNLRSHLRRRHGWTADEEAEHCPKCGKFFKKSILVKHIAESHGEKRIILVSWRATRSNVRKCDNCKKEEKQTWRYAESNKGTVFICDKCKQRVRNRSFGRLDAYDVPSKIVRRF